MTLADAVHAGTLGSHTARTATIRVLVPIASPGPFAEHNKLIRRGAAIAVDELNAKGGIGGHRIQLVPAPDRDAARVLARGRSSGIGVVLLPCNTDAQRSWAAAAAHNHVLALSPCDPDPRAGARSPLNWPIAMSGNAEAAQLTALVIRDNIRGVFVLDAKTPSYVRVLTRYLRAAAKLDGIRIVGSASVGPDNRDAAAVAAAIQKSGAHGVLTAIPSPRISALLAKLREAGVRARIYATDGMDAQLDLQGDTSALKDVLFASFGFARPSAEQFQKDYAARYRGLPPGSFPGLGFETIHVLAVAVAKAGSTTPAAIDAVFRKGFTVPGVALGDVTYRGRGRRQPVANVGIASVIRGDYVPLFSSVPVRVPAP